MTKEEIIDKNTKIFFTSILNGCAVAIQQKNRKGNNNEISKEECEHLYHKYIKKESSLFHTIKLKLYVPIDIKPHSFLYKDLLKIMNFYKKSNLTLNDLAKLKQQLEENNCMIFNSYYKAKFTPEALELYLGRFLESNTENNPSI